MIASKSSLERGNDLETAIELTRDVIGWIKRRGLTTQRAILEAARWLDITPDLTWRLHYRAKIVKIPLWKLRHIERRFVIALDLEIAELERQTQLLRDRKTKITGIQVNACATGWSGLERRNSQRRAGDRLTGATTSYLLPSGVAVQPGGVNVGAL